MQEETSLLKNFSDGFSDFAELVDYRCYYVDKTSFIKKVFARDADPHEPPKSGKILLITRPRRFGKTLLLSTFFHFLRINEEQGKLYQQKLFAHTQIIEDREFCAKFMGKFPTVFITFKDITQKNFATAYNRLVGVLCEEANRHEYLLQSHKLTQNDKEDFRLLTSKRQLKLPEYQDDFFHGLKTLTRLLHKHYGVKAVLLIDEYDVPLAKAQEYGNYDEMKEVVRSVLSEVLKDNSDLYKAVLTGCLRVSKESIFTGLNNLSVNSVVSSDRELSEILGFTPSEVKCMLEYYGLSCHEKEVKAWYDGYRIAGSEIYCPWDLICFCKSALKSSDPKAFILVSYWLGTSSNDAIRDFMRYLDEDAADKMQALLKGQSIEIIVNEQLNYDEIRNFHRSDDFWTLLLSTGYLTAEKVFGGDPQAIHCTVRIPNRGIALCFERNIAEYYRFDQKTGKYTQDIVELLLQGEAPSRLENAVMEILKTFVSVRDLAVNSPKELFYQGLMNGILSGFERRNLNDFHSNCEAGDGYADIIFRSDDRSVGVIIELKVAKKPQDLSLMAKKALGQIADRRYDEYFSGRGQDPSRICLWGLAFCGKYCAAATEIKQI